VDRVRQFWKDGIIDWAIQQGHPTVVPDPALEGKEDGERSFVVVPMRGMGRCAGVFVLACNKSSDAFTAGELDLIAFLSHQAAIALENARLYQSLEETNRKLRESQNQLVQAGKLAAVGQLAGGVAHEVNNPLQIILSRVQLLMMRHRDVPRLQDDLKLIESNVKRISKIIRSLLDFARYNSGEMEWADVDLAHLARQTCTLIQHQFDKAGISLTIDAPADLPNVFGNAGEIEQVFLNLLLNAQHAMPSGGQIEIRMRAVQESVVVSVADTGIGIPKDVLPKIFEPFFTTRSSQGGTGLGLSIIYGIIEKHRGRIEVESQVCVGTTFTIYLPTSEKM
jgi:signal transduction histidine kinase